MTTKLKIPKLRFKEFSGEWEEKKLLKLTKIFDGTHSTPNYVDSGVPFYSVEHVTANQFINTKYISKEVFDKENKRVKLEKNDILMTRIGDIGTSRLLDWNVEASFYVSLALIKQSKLFNSSFLNQYIKFSGFQKELWNKTIHVAFPKKINLGEIGNCIVKLPSIPEQQKIASFFSLVDEKIEKIKEKKKNLEDYKKGVMQKIFSQEIRFKDENGEEFEKWEEKKLGEIGDFQTSSIDKLSREGEKEVYLVNYMNVYRHESINNSNKNNLQIVTAKDSQILSNNLKKGDILFTPSSETPDDIGHSVVIFEDLDNCVYSYHLMRFRPKIQLNILYSHYFCNIPEILNQLAKLSTGSTRFTISVKSFSSIKVKLPTLPEQKKIAEFLLSIDKKIEKTKEELVGLENFKKGLLQNMFI